MPFALLSAAALGVTVDDRVRSAGDAYVRGYFDVDELERKLDDLLGIVHARWELEQLRRSTRRVDAAAVAAAWFARLRQIAGER